MRPKAAKPVVVRGKKLGGDKPLICFPLVGKIPEAALEEAKKAIAGSPDVIELRVDAWDFITDKQTSMKVLGEIRKLTDIPLLLTCRSHLEGGFQEVSAESRIALYKGAIEEKLVDLVDIELISGYEEIKNLKQIASPRGVYVVVSFHDFKKTPPKEVIFATIAKEIAFGGDVAKVAIMPQSMEDVLALMSATLMARREFPDIPLITMSMGALGSITRIAGWLFGSDLTFAVGVASSAPGQIPADELREVYKLLYSLYLNE